MYLIIIIIIIIGRMRVFIGYYVSTLLLLNNVLVESFTLPTPSTSTAKSSSIWKTKIHNNNESFSRISSSALRMSSMAADEKCTIQILMSDTGGGHRASANALRDAFDTLHPGKIECDIVDIYTDYGPFFPVNSYVPIYKIMAEYSFLWKWFYEFGETDFGLWLNDFLLEVRTYIGTLQFQKSNLVSLLFS